MQSINYGMAIGVGESIAQYGEIIQGVLHDDSGKLHRFLMSLPCPALVSKATITLGSSEGFEVFPAHKQKAAMAIRAAAEFAKRDITHASLILESGIPEGKGLGSSTADCVASVRAFCDVFRIDFTENIIARIVTSAELASGNVMFFGATLYAHREGRALEDYYRPFPQIDVLGFDTQPDAVVETLEFPPARYAPVEIEHFRVLREGIVRAMRTNDLRLLGRVATASARINQSFLPKPAFSDLCEISTATHSLGLTVAHSGTVAALLFDPTHPETAPRIAAARSWLSDLGFSNFVQFRTGPSHGTR